MLTERELEAGLRVLAALKTPQSATVVLTWDDDMQRMYPGLARAGYVRTRDVGGSRKSSSPFRWDTVEITPLGLTYLTQIQSAQRAQKKRA
jgi:hypothetical protein